ncbi:ROK family protein [Parapedobacter tibetensis]|uniref:ROK family protein n=1 Tax=Parapedobacter tibetensis TaxID=2972951 RepID=UPI00214D73B7|nr:ROK family protein [Parapedobacter tibetensis]
MEGSENTLVAAEEEMIAAADIGGSHITVGLVKAGNPTVVDDYTERIKVDSKGLKEVIFTNWFNAFERVYEKSGTRPYRIAFAMPGPFDYAQGVSLIKGLDKYENLYSVDIREAFAAHFGIVAGNIRFRNDAEAFLHGEVIAAGHAHADRVLGFTLGTGFGSAFSHGGKTSDKHVGLESYKDSIVDDYLTTRWFHKECHARGMGDLTVSELGRLAIEGDEHALQIFEEFSLNLTAVISRKAVDLEATDVILGGNIAKAHALFLPNMRSVMRAHGIRPRFRLAQLGEHAALVGAACLFFIKQDIPKQLIP